MAWHRISILDVGHGNCAVLLSEELICIFDAGSGSVLNEFLETNDVREIEALLISHADADHIAGAIGLLANTDRIVKRVLLNPDATKGELFQDFRVALEDARRKRGTRVTPQLTTDVTGELDRGSIRLEVLAPTPEVALGGAGGRDLAERRLKSNSVSAVIRLVHAEEPVLLLTGDLDRTGLENLLKEGEELRSRVLVFPHHGGASGNDPGEFAALLCENVRPDMVIFSIGRERFQNPNPVVVESIRKTLPGVRILCTQLSKNCARVIPAGDPTHLGPSPAAGKLGKTCCAGTIDIELEGGVHTPKEDQHKAFIAAHAPTALCSDPASS